MRPTLAESLALVILLLGPMSVSGEEQNVSATQKTAQKVDQLLMQEAAEAQSTAAPACNDETFVRRVYLDIIGRPPAPEEVIVFALNPDTAKRTKLVDRLLGDPRFGRNWARYWRDVILYRRTEQRAMLVSSSLERHLTAAFNENRPWSKIAASFVTAKGDVRVDGSTAIIMAQAGRPEETVAELSRIFLGIQIQCAQCHDHPTDRWKREQFHELAAFFPRVAVRPDRSGQQRSFVVSVNDRPFNRRRANNNNRRVGTPEHRMPNLENPSRWGKIMQPVFFLSGEKLSFGTPDALRRDKLAQWITDDDNPWFAKAYVNRMWSELVGEGFYEPVDDIGPDRSCSAPKTLDFLAEQFTKQGHDVQWLFRVITATEAYRRQSRSRRSPDAPPFAANCAQRLRGDQLYDALTSLLGLQQRVRRRARQSAYRVAAGPRGIFNQEFGYDPSQRREEIAGSIQQALAMMNSRLINRAIKDRPGTKLGRLLRLIPDNEQLIVELYLQALSRQPTKRELKTCQSYIKQVGDRGEAFEDILWSLVNSTEFLHRK